MSRPFAVFDIDGTLVRWQLFHAVVDELAKQGQFSPEIYAQIKLARMEWKNRAHNEAFKDYERKLVDIYDTAIKDLSPERFDSTADTVIEQYRQQTYTYTRNLIKELKSNNYLLFAISGSQSEIVGKLAGYYNFDDFMGTEYARKNGRFTGEITLHAKDKKKALHTLVDKYGLGYQGSIAIGDSPSDIPMMEATEKAIAFNPDQALYNAAQIQDWDIVVERKNVIYELVKRNDAYILK